MENNQEFIPMDVDQNVIYKISKSLTLQAARNHYNNIVKKHMDYGRKINYTDFIKLHDLYEENLRELQGKDYNHLTGE